MAVLLVVVHLLFAFATASAYTDRPFLIAVGGGSASGKTYKAKRIVAALGAHRATLVSADDYYKPERQPQQFYRDGAINYDHPTAVDLETLAAHLSYLRSGFPVQVNEYTYGQKVETPKRLTHHPKEFIVIEGIFALYPKIADLVDYRVFVDVDADKRLERRLKRDVEERGLIATDVEAYFHAVVQPMHEEFVQGSAMNADAVIRSPDGADEVAEIVRAVEAQAIALREVKSSIMLATYRRALRRVQAARPDQFTIRRIEDLHPSQPDLGYLALSYKSDLFDHIVRETALRPERASSLEEYLARNPVPVIEVDGKTVVTDHHHLMVALQKKGLGEFLTTRADESTVDPERLAWVRAQPRALGFHELRDNPYRSLASLVRDLGYVRKTGKPHEEFTWADYYREHLSREHQVLVTEELLLDVHERQRLVDLATTLAKDPRARDLPGFIPENCEETLERTAG